MTRDTLFLLRPDFEDLSGPALLLLALRADRGRPCIVSEAGGPDQCRAYRMAATTAGRDRAGRRGKPVLAIAGPDAGCKVGSSDRHASWPCLHRRQGQDSRGALGASGLSRSASIAAWARPLRNPADCTTGNLRIGVMHKLPDVPICRSPRILIYRMRLDVYRKPEVLFVPSRALSRGALRDRHERWARDAMDALVTRAIASCGRTALKRTQNRVVLASRR
jgi:hypothetical protein